MKRFLEQFEVRLADFFLVFFLTLLAPQFANADNLAAKLQQHVETLAQYPGGRVPGTQGHLKTRAYLHAQLENIGLAPSGLGSNASGFEVYEEMKSSYPRELLGKILYEVFPINQAGPKNANQSYSVHNIIGVVRSPDPSVKAWRMIIAHYDHLGPRDGKEYPGAADNAAGTAVLIELSRLAVAYQEANKDKPLPFHLMFAWTDREEVSTMGHSLVGATLLRNRIEKEWGNLSEFVVMAVDLLGVQMIEGEKDRIFFLAQDGIDQACLKHAPLNVTCAPVSILEGVRFPVSLFPKDMLERCDYAPFRHKGVKTAFITGGSPWFYHTPEDKPSRIDFSLLEKTTHFIFQTLIRKDLDTILSHTPFPKDVYSNDTLDTFFTLIQGLRSQPTVYPLTSAEKNSMEKKQTRLQQCKMSPCEKEEVKKVVFDFLVLLHELGVRKSN